MSRFNQVLVFAFSMGVVLIGLASGALADPSPLPSGIPLSAVAPAVNHWTSIINAFTTGSLVMSVGGLLEVLLRLLPTKQPLSIAYALDDGFKALGSFFKALGDALDKILPNRLSG